MSVLHEIVPRIAEQITSVQEDLYMVAIKAHRSEDDAGVVLVHRPSEDDWLTWEWYAGTFPGGARLHTGHYDMTYDEAMMDFEARGGSR